MKTQEEFSPNRVLLRPREAASTLGLSERALWGLQASGEIPAVRIGRSVRYRPVDLETYAERLAKGGK